MVVLGIPPIAVALTIPNAGFESAGITYGTNIPTE